MDAKIDVGKIRCNECVEWMVEEGIDENIQV
jgi:predicted sulfurtransferase